MRFASFEVIYQKFFLNLRSGGKSKSDWWARERIGLLKRHGFLNAKRISFTGESYFLSTELAHTALSSLRLSRSFVRPLDNINVTTFEHDKRVTFARLALEQAGRATNWCGERRLKSETALTVGLPRAYQPDAIYWNKLGEPVAFELELSVKQKERYEDKIRKYVDVIRQAELKGDGFRAVLFVTCHDAIFTTLTDLTQRHLGKFKIEKYLELVGESRSKGVIYGE